MIILGLGSNLAHRISNLRRGLTLIKSIPNTRVLNVSPLYLSDALLPENTSPMWDQPYINLALSCETSLSPDELQTHLKEIEKTVGRKQEKRRWGPRVLDIDILAWDDLVRKDELLIIPHRDLCERPFALWPLADIAPEWIFPEPGPYQGKKAAQIVERWGSRFSGEAPLHTRQIPHRIDTAQLVGILNVTPDSFSDGGVFNDPEEAVRHAQNLVAAGAEIIDIGAESTAPNATPLDAKTEWLRLLPVISSLENNISTFLIHPKISIDTRHASVAEKALHYNINWINDVTGLVDPAMRQVLANATVDCVVMHHVSIPATREKIIPREQDPVAYLYQWSEQQIAMLKQQGIAEERIILDVGIGFGKSAEQSYMLLKNIKQFKNLGVRLLVGHSRKSFYQLFTAHPAEARDVETTVTSLFLDEQGVDYLRIHNVDMCARAFRIKKALFTV